MHNFQATYPLEAQYVHQRLAIAPDVVREWCAGQRGRENIGGINSGDVRNTPSAKEQEAEETSIALGFIETLSEFVGRSRPSGQKAASRRAIKLRHFQSVWILQSSPVQRVLFICSELIKAVSLGLAQGGKNLHSVWHEREAHRPEPCQTDASANAVAFNHLNSNISREPHD